jgi:hypothetical protein
MHIMSQEEPIRIHQEESLAKDGPVKKLKRKWPKHWKKFTELELLVIQTLKGDILTSQGLANRLTIENSSSFRSKLADLVERMILIKTRNGYQINK